MTVYNNMGIDSPNIGDGGTVYSAKVNSSFGKIDEHNHSTGQGRQIPTDGIENGAVSSLKLAVDAVETVKIKDESVTYDKLSPNLKARLSELILHALAMTEDVGAGTGDVDLVELKTSGGDSSPLVFNNLKMGDFIEIEMISPPAPSGMVGILSMQPTASGVMGAQVWVKDQDNFNISLGSAEVDDSASNVSFPVGGFKTALQVPSDGNYSFTPFLNRAVGSAGTVNINVCRLVGKVWRNVSP